MVLVVRAERRPSCRRRERREASGEMVLDMRIDIVTLFPDMVEPVLAASMLGRARARGLVDIRVVNLRDYAEGKHRVTDDYQFGGGGGMVLKPEPLFAAVEALRTPGARVVLMDPRGRTLTQQVAAELAREPHLILLAGRYEGVDERVSERLADDAVSIGDYVLTGGELPALVVTDAVTRLLPGVLGAEGAAERESFASGLLEPPQYTRPEEFRGARVPAVLLSGDHARIARWRRVQALWRTWRARPELLEGAGLTPEERAIVERFKRGETPEQLEPSAH
jgi:tRNA (guanine37-N1)-methyltransferase